MEIIDNKENGQFEYRTEDHLAYVTYRMRGNVMYLMYTFVPNELNGNGIASTIARKALNYAKTNNYKITVLCPFISDYVKKHPKWYQLYVEIK